MKSKSRHTYHVEEKGAITILPVNLGRNISVIEAPSGKQYHRGLVHASSASEDGFERYYLLAGHVERKNITPSLSG